MTSNAAPQAALRAALLLRALGPAGAVPEPSWVPIWRQRASQDAADAARILLSTMPLHG